MAGIFEHIEIGYKYKIGFFILVLILLLSIVLNLQNIFNNVSRYPLTTVPIKIDGKSMDWTKEYLRWVDGDRISQTESPHIMALYSYIGEKDIYFSVFYPDWEKEKSAVLLGLDFTYGGNKNFLDLPVYTAFPLDLIVKLERDNAILFDADGLLLGKLNFAYNSKIGFIEFSIPKKLFQYMDFADENEIKIMAVAYKETSKTKKILDTVPNGIKKMIKGIGPGFLLLKSASSLKAAGTVKLMIVHHGNQAVGGWYPNLLSENGGQNGYNPILKVHFDTGVKANFHISGTTLVGLRWQGGYDDVWYALGNRTWFQAMKDGFDSNLFGLVGSTFPQNIMPYMFKQENIFLLEYENELFQHFFNRTPVIAWVPERTWVNDPNIQWHTGDGYTGPNYNVKDNLMCQTFTSVGFVGVVLDGNQHHNWFHDPDPMGQNDNCVPHKIIDPTTGEFSGLVALFNNRDLQDRICGGNAAWDGILATMNWVATFGDGAIGVYGDDWEKAAGYSETWPDFLTQGYIETIWNIRNQSWIESITVNDFVNWFSFEWDGQGTPSYPDTSEYPSISIPYGTYENPVIWLGGGDYYQRWDDDASESWRLKTDPRSYRDMMIFAQNAITSAEDYTLQDWRQNRLIKIARIVLGATTYEWMWHDDADNISDWQEKMSAHTKNAAYYAETAKWAYNPAAYGAKVQTKDVDGDSVNEYIIQNNKIMAILEPDGGRICAMFARDRSGQGYVIIGNDVAQYYAVGGNWPDMTSCGITTVDWVEPDHLGALLYHMGEVNDGFWYDTGQPTGNPYGDCTQYPDTVYSVETGADYILFKNGNTPVKKVTLIGNNNYFNVEIDVNTPPEYTDWPNKKLVIVQFSPDYLNILKNGKDAIIDYTFTDGANSGYGVRNVDNTVKGWVSVPSGTVVEKSYLLLTREYVLKHTDSANPFFFKLGAEVVEPATGTLSGNVKDTNGQGLADVTVAVSGPQVRDTLTSPAGTYSIENLPVGFYTVTASKLGYQIFTTNNIQILDGQTTILNITLYPAPPATGSISGIITESNTGYYIPGASIVLSNPSNSYFTNSLSDGSYFIDNVIIGIYNMTVSKNGYYSKTIQNITIYSGFNTIQNVELSKIPAEPGNIKGKITITVGDYSGVAVYAQGVQNYSTTNIDAFGNYQILNVEPGEYSVFAYKSGYSCTPSSSNIIVYSLQDSYADFTLEPNPYWPGDFDQDEDVDMDDYNLLMQNFGGNNLKYDLNGDGIVDGKDLVIFGANYGKTGRRP